jgi:hypothetical protein
VKCIEAVPFGVADGKHDVSGKHDRSASSASTSKHDTSMSSASASTSKLSSAKKQTRRSAAKRIKMDDAFDEKLGDDKFELDEKLDFDDTYEDDDDDDDYEGSPRRLSRRRARASGDKRHNEPLNTPAVCIMQHWFDVHRDNPYPDEDAKARFARDGGITLQQVNGWFANRRNRTNSTRPKMKRKQLEDRIKALFAEQPRAVADHLDTLLDLVHKVK